MIIPDNDRVIVSRNVLIINETLEYETHLDLSEEPESVNLDHIEEYPLIFDINSTDDDTLMVENNIENETPEGVVPNDAEQDNEANTSNHEDKLASINEQMSNLATT